MKEYLKHNYRVTLVYSMLLLVGITVIAQQGSPIKSNSNNLQIQKCKRLIDFRDKELFMIYKKAMDKYQLHESIKINIESMMADLLNDTKWTRSEAALTIGIISKIIQTTCKLINNILEMSPATSIAGKAVNKTEKAAHIFLQAIKAGENLQEIAEQGAEQVAMKELLSARGDLGKAARTAWDFTEDITEMLNLTDDHTKLKVEVRRAVDMMDREIVKYEQVSRASKEKLTEAWVFKEAIDQYLLENCKEEELSKEPVNKKINKSYDPVSSISLSAGSQNNSFFIFLSTSIYLDNKIQTIISPAMPFDGQLNKDLSGMKKKFIKMIDEQFLSSIDDEKFLFNDNASKIIRAMTEEKPKTKAEIRREIIQGLEKNGNEAISVHSGKLYSKKLLKSLDECHEAVEEFKSNQRELSEGLATPIFIQLN